tara:strand:+ start:3336 stop:3542 length:207 start_codon:yes stop_codon:yes gene_type:complete
MNLLMASLSVFGFPNHTHKNRDELIGFIAKMFEFIRRSKLRLTQQIQPVVRFIEFLQGTFHLADEIRI